MSDFEVIFYHTKTNKNKNYIYGASSNYQKKEDFPENLNRTAATVRKSPLGSHRYRWVI